jgi:hypothetical protein
MTVLGEPVRLGSSTEQIALSGAGAHGDFHVYGYDADGYGTWIRPDDVKVDYDPDVVRIEPDGDSFTVTALAKSGASVITVTAGGLTTHLAASVGSEPRTLSALDVRTAGVRVCTRAWSVRRCRPRRDARAVPGSRWTIG